MLFAQLSKTGNLVVLGSLGLSLIVALGGVVAESLGYDKTSLLGALVVLETLCVIPVIAYTTRVAMNRKEVLSERVGALAMTGAFKGFLGILWFKVYPPTPDALEPLWYVSAAAIFVSVFVLSWAMSQRYKPPVSR